VVKGVDVGQKISPKYPKNAHGQARHHPKARDAYSDLQKVKRIDIVQKIERLLGRYPARKASR